MPKKRGRKVSNYSPTSRPGPTWTYPWEEWLDGSSTWIITQGTDFSCTRSSMIVMIRRMAKRLGVKVSVCREGEESLAIINK